MQKTFLTAVFVFALSATALHAEAPAPLPTPLPPETGGIEVPKDTATTTPTDWREKVPVHLSIPSISLEAPVVQVGTNEKGEMDVPDGKTNNVGWYQHGTVPGQTGSAVLDAHVYAAFNDLRYVQPGDEILVVAQDGETLRFIVEEAKVAKLEDVSTYFLFERADKKRLNLITCAGAFVRSMDTYDHRLIVYAVLAEE